jgi:hypothetical protein
MTSTTLAPIAAVFGLGLIYSASLHAEDREPPAKSSWQMTSVVGTYVVEEPDGKRGFKKKTVNFYLDGTFGRGRVCLEAPASACDDFDARLGGSPEPGRFRMLSLAGQDSATGAHVAVLDTTTRRAVKCSVQLAANAIGNTMCALLPH